MTLINGRQQMQIDVTDRGLAYGDGLFETIAYVSGTLSHWDLHWQRLQLGAQRLDLELPDEQQLLEQIDTELVYSIESLQTKNEPTKNTQSIDRIIKVIVTRGQGGRGYMSPEPQQISVIVTAYPWPERSAQDYAQGIHAMVCQTCLARQPALAGIKHLNRLEQVLGRNEFRDLKFQEAIMLACSDIASRQEDLIMVEGTSSNLFFVNHGKLYTPKIDTCGVQGTIREAILSLASQNGIEVQQAHYPLRQLRDASEVFFTNSVFGILPVASITVSELSSPWHYNDRIISAQLAAIINKALKRPDKFN